MLVIIAALAEALDIDWSDAYKAAQSIQNLTEQLGAPVSDQTIGKNSSSSRTHSKNENRSRPSSLIRDKLYPN